MNTGKSFAVNLSGDVVGGMAAMLLSLPSAIAYGLIIFAPLGNEFSGMAAIGGIIGTITMGLVTPFFGGSKRLISAPCAPAAAVLSLFASELVKPGFVPLEIIPLYITLVSLLAGIVQILIGNLGGGNFIKYIPYPVVTGYLWGVSISILNKQVPKFLGIPKGIKLEQALIMPGDWRWESIFIGAFTMLAMVYSPKITKSVPPVIIALVAGIIAYFGISIINPTLLHLENNEFVVGKIAASTTDLVNNVGHRWASVAYLNFNWELVKLLVVPVFSLSVLLSINTLNACVVMDTLTFSRHNSKRELIGQGAGNIVSAMLCGVPGGGLVNASILSHKSGGNSRISGIVVGVTALLVLLFFGKMVAWLPLSTLAGILIVSSLRMIDVKTFSLLKNKSTIFDFLVIIVVVLAAVCFSLLVAALVGTGMAIFLFFREQMQSSVIRSMATGNEVFSKKIRLSRELEALEKKGRQTVIIELQGQLFFGTTDQLISRLFPYFKRCKYAILDMRKVQSVDFTAANMLKQILERIKSHQGYLVISSIPLNLPTKQNIKEYLENLGLSETENLKFFDNMDAALEWAEDEILKTEKVYNYEDDKILEFKELELFEGCTADAVQALKLIAIEKNFKPGELIFKTGDVSDEIYLVRKGTVKIMLPLKNGSQHHLLTIGTGGIFGEMAFLDHVKRSADARVIEELHLFILSKEKFMAISKQYPEIEGKFFEHLALLIANRLRQSNIEFNN